MQTVQEASSAWDTGDESECKTEREAIDNIFRFNGRPAENEGDNPHAKCPVTRPACFETEILSRDMMRYRVVSKSLKEL